MTKKKVSMFSEWTDPYDIDNYYNDMSSLFVDTKQAPSSSMYQQMPERSKIEIKPEAPTGVVVNAPTPPTGIKSSFEVKPTSIFLDGHPVGSQPEYNVLQSGPPAPTASTPAQVPARAEKLSTKEGYWNNMEHTGIDWVHIVIFIMIMVLLGFLIQARCQITNINDTLQMIIKASYPQGMMIR